MSEKRLVICSDCPARKKCEAKRLSLSCAEQVFYSAKKLEAENARLRAKLEARTMEKEELQNSLINANGNIEHLTAELEEIDQIAAEYGVDRTTMFQLVKSQIKTAEENRQLSDKLTESQCRERAAVEDILIAHDRGRCAVCKHKRKDGGACKKWPDRSCFEWRGPEKEGR